MKLINPRERERGERERKGRREEGEGEEGREGGRSCYRNWPQSRRRPPS
jgi:hypothetical protein